MANILSRYGIKEVADVTFYEIDKNGHMAAPVLYLDTLKVSTIEQTAEQAEARGGKGNPPLIIWDYGKEITVTLEDALFSAKSMALMFGGADAKVDEKAENTKIVKTWSKAALGNPASAPAKLPYGGKEIAYSEAGVTLYTAEGTEAASWAEADYITAAIPVKEIGAVEISANTFPGTYYVTGDTYARSEVTGDDEFFQFIIPKAKMNAENTITKDEIQHINVNNL